MSIAVVRDLTRKIMERKLSKGVPKVKQTLEQCLLNVQAYINETVNEFLDAETFSDLQIAEWIYKDEIDATEEETYVKANLFAASKSLERIIGTISNQRGGLSYSNIFSFRFILRDFLHDINEFINFYRRRTDSTFQFLTGGKNYLTSSFETFMATQNLFYNSVIKVNPYPYKESQGMSSMALRQSIEIKTKRILGIYKIKKNRPRIPDYGFKRIFDFIEANAHDIEYNPINFSVLKLIYKWSCAYIHNGDIGFIWQTETAINYIKPYFALGSHTSDGRTIRSAFGAFKLSNFSDVRRRLNAFVGVDYSIEYLQGSQVEAIIVSH